MVINLSIENSYLSDDVRLTFNAQFFVFIYKIS